jgi:hypothetical protein
LMAATSTSEIAIPTSSTTSTTTTLP